MPDYQVVTRSNDGKFAKGVSGNPKGRPPMLAPELRQQLHDATPEITEKVVEKALAGDLAAAKIILDRTAPTDGLPPFWSILNESFGHEIGYQGGRNHEEKTLLSRTNHGSC